MRYVVKLKEIHTQKFVVEDAESMEEAIRLALDGEGIEMGPSVYHRTVDDEPEACEADVFVEGDDVIVPNPRGNDAWNNSFLGTIENINYETNIATVRDMEDNYYDVDSARLKLEE